MSTRYDVLVRRYDIFKCLEIAKASIVLILVGESAGHTTRGEIRGLWPGIIMFYIKASNAGT